MGDVNNDSHSVCNFAKFGHVGVHIYYSFTFKQYLIGVFLDLYTHVSVCSLV